MDDQRLPIDYLFPVRRDLKTIEDHEQERIYEACKCARDHALTAIRCLEL